MNTQPWHFHVVTGAPLDRIRQGNTARNLAGVKPQREIPTHGAYQGIHRRRQIEVAVQLFEAMGIERDDKAGRQDWVMRGFRQFDAPVSIVVTYDKSLEPATISHFDLGAVDLRPGSGGLDPWIGHGDQRPGHHAVGRGARPCPDTRRAGHHDLYRDGLPKLRLRRQRC